MKKIVLGALAAALMAATTPSAFAQSKEIAVIVKSANSNFWQNVRKGAEAAIKDEAGYTLTFQGPAAESNVADEVNMVENAVNRKVAGIVLAPSDPDALIPSARKAWENGIPLVLIDSLMSPTGEKYYQAFLSTDNDKAGRLCAEELIKRMGTTGKVAIMSYVAGVGSEIGRVGGFTAYIKEHSKIDLIGPFYSQSQMATALNQTIDTLAANPDLKGIFGANEPTAEGMGRAIVQSGKVGQITAIGFDGNQGLQDFVRNGTLQGIAVQGSFQMGQLGIQTVAKIIANQKVPKNVDTGVVFVTKDNLDKPEAKNVLY
ncbi:MAG: ABC transporter substrate-binding protein [Azospirillaceae bacterium]|nr:ABC transporter substrate-binding protein [Azospirillaceae bacterium]